MLATQLLCANPTEKPNGCYASFDDYRNGKVSHDLSSIDIAPRKLFPGIRIMYDDGTKTKRWSRRKQGKLKLIKNGVTGFLLPQKVKLRLYDNYSWYTTRQVAYSTGVVFSLSPMNNTMALQPQVLPGDNEATIRYHILNMKTQKRSLLTEELLLELLVETPELLEEFQSNTYRKDDLFDYLERFLELTNK